MPGLTLPPFPDDVKTHPLLIVDFALIKAGDTEEIGRLWEAATGLGFWYLKNHGADKEADGMFDMGEEFMDLPMEEKMKFRETSLTERIGTFGYKAAGEYITNEKGGSDMKEYISIGKDDILAYPDVVHRTYPTPVVERMELTIKPFLMKALDVNMTLLSVFEKKLGLPKGVLIGCHSLAEHSGSEARTMKSPAKLNEAIAHGAHTDVGSLAFLHNRLGGLQVFPPGSTEWQYVRPLPGLAVCNIGDTLTLLTGGVLHSNLHRVVAPPGEQDEMPRWSVVYHTRPGKDVPLRPLEQSDMIRDAVESMSPEQRERFYPNATAGEWFARRVKHLRASNRTGPESWTASRGMEYRPDLM